MPEEKIFLKIAGAIYNNYIKPKGEEKAQEFVNENFSDKRLLKKTSKWLEETYGTEVYFNNLDKYLQENNTIRRLIRVAHGEYDFEENNPTTFTAEHYANFIMQHPQYADPALKNPIQNVFTELYNRIHQSVNKISPYSDFGKQQRDFKNLNNNQTAILLRSQEGLKRDIICAFRNSQNKSESGINSFTADLIGVSEKVEKHLNDIQVVENNYQKNRQFSEAIQKYQDILSEIVCLSNNTVEFQKLISALYCNIALCYSNIGNYESAQKYIKRISTEVSDDNPKYHFICAIIIVNAEDTAHYIEAAHHAKRSIELDPKYHKAFILEKYICTILQPTLLSSIVNEYDSHFCELISDNATSEFLFEYYSNRGLIHFVGSDVDNALIDFEKACEYGDDATLQFNIASALYIIATISLPKNTRIMFQELPPEPLLRAYNILKYLLETENPEQAMRKRVISLYLSVCFLLGKPHNLILDDVNTVIDELDSETVRLFLLGSHNISTKILEKYLDESDRSFIIASEYYNSGQFDQCKSYLEDLLIKDKKITPPLYLILIQSCIAIFDIQSYWKYREHSDEYQLTGSYIVLLDARAYELDGNIDKAKTIIDDLTSKTVDYGILINAIRFYARNGCHEKQGNLYTAMYNKWCSNELCVTDIVEFMMSYVTFLTTNQNDSAINVLNSLPPDTLPDKIYNKLYVNYYLQINDPGQLLPYAEKLFEVSPDISSGRLLAQTFKRLFRYDDAANICESLLTIASTDSQKNEIYWMLSDICFLNGDKDRSYEWAVQARDIVQHIPEDPSHQIFMSRAMCCGHMEGLATIIEYKHKHPVVVDYLHEFHIDTESSTAGEDLIMLLKSIGCNPDEKNEYESQIISYYKKGMIPTNMIIKYFSDDWFNMLMFAQKNKLNVDLGDRELLRHDIESIDNSIVVDAQTLIIMMMFDCIHVLDYINTVYINAGSVDYLQYICFSTNCPWAIQILEYIYNATNINVTADGFLKNTSNDEIFDVNFMTCCKLSKKLNVPFLYHDAFAKIIQMNTRNIDSEIKFVSIRAMCGFAQTKIGDLAEQWYYNLLRGCTFIICGAKTILYQIRSNNYEVTDELMQPFLFCRSDYDMDSFASVYCAAIQELITEHSDSAEKLAEIVIRDTIRVWKRGQYHRIYSDKYPNHREKAERINKYAITIGISVRKLFPHPSDSLRKEINSLFS